MITAEHIQDVEIPGKGLTFGTLQRAQALGDYQALAARDRRILHIHLSTPESIEKIIALIK